MEILGILVLWAFFGAIGAVICSAKNRNPIEGLILGGLCGCFGVLIVAVLPRELPKAPRGLMAVTCPRCNAMQNVPDVKSFECWQCHLRTGAPAPVPIPTLKTISGRKITVTCPDCKARLKVSSVSEKKTFKCVKCGGRGQMPLRAP